MKTYLRGFRSGSTENGLRLVILDLGSRGIVLSM